MPLPQTHPHNRQFPQLINGMLERMAITTPPTPVAISMDLVFIDLLLFGFLELLESDFQVDPYRAIPKAFAGMERLAFRFYRLVSLFMRSSPSPVMADFTALATPQPPPPNMAT